MQALGSGIARFLLRIWRIIRWPFLTLAAAFVIAVLYVLVMTPAWSKEAIMEINARHLTMSDVDGSSLPPTPDPKLVDATVQGVDANHNGIRDDVELAIFKKYPNDMKIRAAALQYAMTEQWFLSGKIVDKASWKAAAESDSRALKCLKIVYGGDPSSISDYIETSVFDTPPRRDDQEKVDAYTTSFGIQTGQSCDVTSQTN